MKITINQENLKEGLNNTERIVGKNLTLPILNNILLKTEKNFLRISSTDLEIGINRWILSKTEENGEIVVPGKLFSNFIYSLPDTNIKLETTDNTLKVECENYNNQIKGFNAEEYPLIPKIEDKNFIEIKGSELCEGLKQVISLAAVNQIKPEISGVYFSFLNNQIKMVATDSFRLAEKKIIIKKETEKERSLIVPSKTVQELIHLFADENGLIKIYLSANQILFESLMEETSHPKIQIFSRLIEGEFPNYQEIIPQSFETQVILNKEKFLNQIKIAGLFSSKINDVKIRVLPKKEIIEIFSQNQEIGENKSFLSASIKGGEAEVIFNHKFLLDGLSNIKDSEIIFGLNGDNGPGVLKPLGDPNYIYILMPIKKD